MKLPIIMLALLGSAAAAFAVDPPPDGGYAHRNTAEGTNALFTLTTGVSNTANGYNALYRNTTGNCNTAVGAFALNKNATGFSNTATGAQALENDTTGNTNTASGFGALAFNLTGNSNTAHGLNALASNTTGSNNIAVGFYAGSNLTTGNNNIDIFDSGVAGEANTIRIGTVGTHTATLIAGINGVTVAGGVGVIVDGQGHLGTVTSSARYKKNIQPMKEASAALLSLEPVTFRYKKELDSLGIPQFGLVAEQVAKVDPDLVARDEGGKPYTVRYEAVNAMLLNEFLKKHRKVEAQGDAIGAQEKEIAELRAELKSAVAQIQQVSAQVQTKQDAPRLVSAGE